MTITGLTWTCHICHEECPDIYISVLKKPLIVNGVQLGEQNVRYCNDKIGCWLGAQTFQFVQSTDAQGNPIDPSNS